MLKVFRSYHPQDSKIPISTRGPHDYLRFLSEFMGFGVAGSGMPRCFIPGLPEVWDLGFRASSPDF